MRSDLAQPETAAPPTARPMGRPRKYQNPEDLEAAIDAYFVKCDEDKRPYTMSGLANTLDISRSTLLNYEHRSPEILNAVKRARARVEQRVEEDLLGRDRAPIGQIFSLKNNFGWKDVQEVEHTHTLIAIGQPGAQLPALEPPVIEAQVLPALPASTAQDEPTFALPASLSPVPRND